MQMGIYCFLRDAQIVSLSFYYLIKLFKFIDLITFFLFTKVFLSYSDMSC
jgi:hypothetical protein